MFICLIVWQRWAGEVVAHYEVTLVGWRMHVSVGCTSDHRSCMPLELLGAGSTCRSAMVRIEVINVVKLASDDLPTIFEAQRGESGSWGEPIFTFCLDPRVRIQMACPLERGFSCMFCTSIAY